MSELRVSLGMVPPPQAIRKPLDDMWQARLTEAADDLADAMEALVRNAERTASPADIARGAGPIPGIDVAKRALLTYRQRRKTS